MTRLVVSHIGITLLGVTLLLCAMASAQQRTQSVAQRNPGYDAGREVSVQGSVLSYSEATSSAPSGPHVKLQTSSGVLDVHLGNARLLESNHFTVAAGETIRVVGQNVSFASGSQFVARVVQKGNQTLMLRNAQGFPLRPVTKSAVQQGAL